MPQLTPRRLRRARQRSRSGRPLSAALVAAISFVCLSPSSATATPSVSFAPAFREGVRAGEASAASLNMSIAGTEYGGFPAPVTELTMRFPAGTSFSTVGFPTCPYPTLEPAGAGPKGCPAGSSAGSPGTFNAIVAFGKEMIKEQGTLETFFTPDGGVAMFLFGHEPVLIELLAHGTPEPAVGGYGPALSFAMPLVETVPGADYLSLTNLSFGLGASYGALSSVQVPTTCLAEPLWWLLQAQFLGQPIANVPASTRCPIGAVAIVAQPTSATTTPTDRHTASPPRIPGPFTTQFVLARAGRPHRLLVRRGIVKPSGATFATQGGAYRTRVSCEHCIAHLHNTQSDVPGGSAASFSFSRRTEVNAASLVRVQLFHFANKQCMIEKQYACPYSEREKVYHVFPGRPRRKVLTSRFEFCLTPNSVGVVETTSCPLRW
jgi:hypothetical protein